jgi:hypothetical protein
VDANTGIALCRKPPFLGKPISIAPGIFDLSPANFLKRSRRAVTAFFSLHIQELQ